MSNEEIGNPVIPYIYCNGLEVTVSATDVNLVLKRGEEHTGVLYMSHTLAKTMITLVGQLLVQYEDLAGYTIPSAQEIGAKMERQEKGEVGNDG